MSCVFGLKVRYTGTEARVCFSSLFISIDQGERTLTLTCEVTWLSGSIGLDGMKQQQQDVIIEAIGK
jgi:hypothetical protein